MVHEPVRVSRSLAVSRQMRGKLLMWERNSNSEHPIERERQQAAAALRLTPVCIRRIPYCDEIRYQPNPVS